MELRLLHTVAHRQTWYGRWGYVFGRGGFAIGKQVGLSVLLALQSSQAAGPYLSAGSSGASQEQ